MKHFAILIGLIIVLFTCQAQQVGNAQIIAAQKLSEALIVDSSQIEIVQVEPIQIEDVHLQAAEYHLDLLTRHNEPINTNYFVEKEPLKDTKYNPSKSGSAGIGLEFNGEKIGVIFSANAYHWDFMGYVSIYNGVDKGSYGQHYSSVMATYSCMSYYGEYKKNLTAFGMYNGYLIDRFAFGLYLGYEAYETGKTYGNPNHVSNWDDVFSTNYKIHSKFVVGVYVKWYVGKRINLFYSYKFNTYSPASNIGIVFNFMAG